MCALRIALICMLMLALPAQSMVALNMPLGTLTPPNAAQAQACRHMAAHHPVAHGAPAHHADRCSESADLHSGLCSLCAFCVAAVALDSASAGQAPLQPGEPFRLRADQFSGFISEPLERPPRVFLVSA